MRKICSLILCVILVLSSISIVFANDEGISVYVDGSKIEFDVKPQTINGRTMVPIRAIFEKMGAAVSWDDATQTAICTKGEITVKMTVDSTAMYINGSLVNMDVSPVVIDGRTLAPARYVAESFGADVQWDDNTKSVIINSNVSVEKTVTLYAADGRTINVYESEAPAYLNVGWFSSIEETKQTLYSPDGNTITVFKAEVPSYLAVGWYTSIEDTKQTLYSATGSTVTVFKNEVPSYLAVGWYKTYAEAQAANKPSSNTVSNSNNSGGSAVYRTPSGKRYHFDPDCGGKNSYQTTLQKAISAGLTPCSKCAY